MHHISISIEISSAKHTIFPSHSLLNNYLKKSNNDDDNNNKNLTHCNYIRKLDLKAGKISGFANGPFLPAVVNVHGILEMCVSSSCPDCAEQVKKHSAEVVRMVMNILPLHISN